MIGLCACLVLSLSACRIDGEVESSTPAQTASTGGVQPLPPQQPQQPQDPQQSQDPQQPQTPQEEPKSKASYLHISFDDVQTCWSTLATNEYLSLWDEPFFAWLKSLHEEYGAKFSLYTYTNVLQGVKAGYASEFCASSDWLKIGFHADKSGHNLNEISYETGKGYWNAFVQEVGRITSDNTQTDELKSLDRMPRLEFFSGSKNGLLGMRDASFGALGFLSADDNRSSYYFDGETVEYLYENDTKKDEETRLTFLSTDLRGDWFANGFSSKYTYRKPTQKSVYDELVSREKSSDFDKAWKSVVVFTHEWQVYQNGGINGRSAWITDACRYANEYEIEFAYPQEKI